MNDFHSIFIFTVFLSVLVLCSQQFLSMYNALIALCTVLYKVALKTATGHLNQ